MKTQRRRLNNVDDDNHKTRETKMSARALLIHAYPGNP